MSRFLPWIVAAVSLFSARSYAGEGEWSRFRGPNGTGISHATTVPARWTEKDYNWKVVLPGVGHSSPVVWGHRVFVTCGDAETARADGSLPGCGRWPSLFGGAIIPSTTYAQHRDSGYATATPAVDATRGSRLDDAGGSHPVGLGPGRPPALCAAIWGRSSPCKAAVPRRSSAATWWCWPTIRRIPA